MFYWVKGDSGGSGDMSKTEILRGVVAERLTAAAQEILAVVERTVAGYEEEASGLRQEVDRQRRQLEALLQPRVTLERRAPIPGLEGHEVVVNEEEEEEQEEEEQQAGVEDTGSLGLQCYEDEEDEDEEQQLFAQLATSSRQRREELKDPDYQITSRGLSDRRRPGRPRISDTQSHLDLRIRILEDSQTDLLSNTVLKKHPLQELQCPRGLQEADFLHLLSSAFPQLAAEKPFDVFTLDRSRRLQPLRVEALTPEEICRSSGHSALYIRLKTAEEPQSSGEDPPPLQRRDDSASSSASAAQTRPSSGRRRRGRPRLGEEPTHHSFRICFLEDSQHDTLSKTVFQKHPLQELQCPRGLQEADFLHLLSSAFPQLAGGNKPFDIFKSDRSRRLHRLRVETLTPEDICRSMKSIGTEKTLLYLRLKGLKTGEEDEQLLQGHCEAPPTVETEAGLSWSRPAGDTVDVLSGSSASQQDVETEEAGDEDGGEVLQFSRRRRGAVLMRSQKTPCRVCGAWYRIQGALIKHAWRHVDEPQCVCGVCGDHFGSVDELKGHLRTYQKSHSCSYCGKSFLTVTGLKCHVTLHTGNRPFHCDVCNKTFARMSSLSVHRWVHVAEKPHKCDVCPKAFGLKAQLRAHSRVHTGRDKYHCSVCGKSFYDLRSLTRHKVSHSGERRYGCEVCGKRFKLSGTLKSHEKIHTTRERPFLCHVCCKTFHSNCGLTTHMRTHSGERPFICSVCSKGFISNGHLTVHKRVHSGEAPYGCTQCGRCFKHKTHLNNHTRSHLGIKLFVCGVCGKACSRQEHLTVHLRTHNGERPYQCTVCDKTFTQSHCLKTHMKSHQGEETCP